MANLKQILFPLLTGVVTLIIMTAFMLKITLDFQILLAFGCVLFFLAGIVNLKRKINPLLTSLLINIPFALVFSILIYNQIPMLLSLPVFFMISTTLALNTFQKKSVRQYVQLAGFVLLVVFISWQIIPVVLSQQLTEIKNEAVDPYTIVDMDGNEIHSKNLIGKVVVLDFFGTWCKPCRQELIELKKVHSFFENDEDVVFYVINTAEAGDTYEKMNKFIAQHDYPFNYAFDRQKNLVNQFNLHGVPYLFIFDKKGKMRLSHIGYNKGETDFVDNIINTIESFR